MQRLSAFFVLLFVAVGAGAATVDFRYNLVLQNNVGGEATIQLSLSGDSIAEGQSVYDFAAADTITASAVVDGQAIDFEVLGYFGSGRLLQSSSDPSVYLAETYPYFGTVIDLRESTTNPGNDTLWKFSVGYEDGFSCSQNPGNCYYYGRLYKLPSTDTNLIYDRSSFYSTNPISFSVVPLPAAAWLFGSALAGLGWLRRSQIV